MRLWLLIVGLLLVLSGGAQAQGTAYTEWNTYSRIVKILPPGFHHFVPIPAKDRVAVSADGEVLCLSWETAISFAQRLGSGMHPQHAVDDIRRAWGGELKCGFRSKTLVHAVEYAVRGDTYGRPVVIVKVVDSLGVIFYVGFPKV